MKCVFFNMIIDKVSVLTNRTNTDLVRLHVNNLENPMPYLKSTGAVLEVAVEQGKGKEWCRLNFNIPEEDVEEINY